MNFKSTNLKNVPLEFILVKFKPKVRRYSDQSKSFNSHIISLQKKRKKKKMKTENTEINKKIEKMSSLLNPA